MKQIFILAAMLCSGLANALDGAIEIIRSPRKTPSTGVIIHKQMRHFIDLEVPVDRVWIGCSNTDPKEDVSLLGIYVEDEDVYYLFYPRRAIHDVPMCLAEELKYRNMMKGAKTVRIVGAFSGIETNPKKNYPKDRTPRRFTNKPKTGGGFFIRLQANKQCVSYFANDCDLPKNYWAGMTPISQ